MTSATVAACQPDLRQIRFEVQHTRIKDLARAATPPVNSGGPTIPLG